MLLLIHLNTKINTKWHNKNYFLKINKKLKKILNLQKIHTNQNYFNGNIHFYSPICITTLVQLVIMLYILIINCGNIFRVKK